MAQDNAARHYKAVQQAQAVQERQKALGDPESFIQLAADLGYKFTSENIYAQVDSLTDEEIAKIYNPGIGSRRHLTSR